MKQTDMGIKNIKIWHILPISPTVTLKQDNFILLRGASRREGGGTWVGLM
jgi:hypothetical protein